MPLPYHPVDDFAMIGWIVDGPPLILAIDAKLPIKTIAELIADAKAHPDKYSFGTSGPASSPNATLMQFNAAARIKIQAVPYRGSARRRPPLPPAQSRAPSFFSQAKALVDTGKLRALAIAGPKRMEAWPDVPTLPELGFKIDTRGFVGLGAGQDAEADRRLSQQAPQRGAADRHVQETDGGARHGTAAGRR